MASRFHNSTIKRHDGNLLVVVGGIITLVCATLDLLGFFVPNNSTVFQDVAKNGPLSGTLSLETIARHGDCEDQYLAFPVQRELIDELLLLKYGEALLPGIEEARRGDFLPQSFDEIIVEAKREDLGS